jgi:hypothetical protein
MKNLEELIDKEKNKETKVLGPFLNKMKRDSGLISELEESTRYLDTEYDNVSIGQRFYHVWFNEHNIIKCKYCARNAKFSVYDRFSDKIDKKDSNYYTHCGSVSCLIDDFKERGNSKQGYGSLIGKISGDTDTRNELLSLTSFLDEEYTNISDSQRFYHVFFNKMELELCEFCGKPRKYGFMNKFSEIRDKRDSNYCRTCIEKKCLIMANIKYSKIGLMNNHGVQNQWDIPGYRESIETTNMERYGDKYYTSTNQFKEKCTEKYNLDWNGKHPTSHQSTKDKKYKTNLGKYGFKCALMDKELMKKSMLEKYGVEHNMRIPEIHEKAMVTMRRYYDYTLPSGKIIKLQGYEKFAMDILLTKFEENDILTDMHDISNITGQIIYNEGNRYYPDIYIKSINKILEVKSPYTYKMHENKNIMKMQRCLEMGMDFEFMIFNSKGNLVNI